jgi:hypothetical protein
MGGRASSALTAICSLVGGTADWLLAHALSPEGWTALATVLLTIVTGGLLVFAFRQDRTTRGQLRAYIFPDDPKIEDVAPLNYPIAILFIKNYGRTPAEKVTAEFALEFDTYPKPTGKALDTPKLDEVSRSAVPPESRIEIRVERDDTLTSPEFEALKAGHAALYVVGVIRYTDNFGDGWVSTVRMMHTYRNVGSTRLEVCPEGNETRRA